MSQLPYSPMHAPAKAVTQEKMWDVLAKHTPGFKPPKAGETAQPDLRVREPLVWLKPVKTGDGSGYVLTQCGRFSIEKRPVNGAPMYMAWLRKDPPHDSVTLGIRTTLKEAEHLCELEVDK